VARTVKPEEFAAKRSEILDAAQRLVLTKGFQQMSVRDILDELQISSGAFHHYFASRGALLDALTDRIQGAVAAQMLPLINDPHRSALEKLQGFFDTLDQLRTAQQATISAVARVWYTDDNAVVRLRVQEAVVKQRAPLLVQIVYQGLREGVFTTAHPDQAGEVLLALLQAMGDTHAQLFLAYMQDHDAPRCINAIVATHAAYMDAVERVLGAPAHSLYRADTAGVQTWLAVL